MQFGGDAVGIILTKAGIFLGIIAIGFGLKKAGFFQRSDFSVLSKIVLNLTLPCAVISNFDGLTVPVSLLSIALIGFACNLVLLGIGLLMARGKPKAEKAFNLINYPGYNIGSFTMPYVQSILGPSAAMTVCLFDAGNAVVCTGGSYTVASTMLGEGKPSVGKFLKKLFSSAPLDTYLVMLALSLLRIELPGPVMDFAQMVGGANAFLAVLMIGIGFDIRFDRSRAGRLVKHLALRFSVTAVLAAAMYFLLPFSEEVRSLLVAVAFSPISSAAPAYTDKIGGDVELASTANSISILIGLALMTVMMIVLDM